MYKITRRSFLVTGGAAMALAAAQVKRPRLGYAQTGSINLYSSRHYNTDDALYEGFTEQTGIGVNLIEGSADELLERILNEGSNSPADIFMTVDAGRLWRAAEEGVFAPIDSPDLEAKIPENLRHPDGLWFGFSKRARVIMYNRDRVNPSELSTYEDLASSQWDGRVLVRSSGNIYNQSLIAGMIETLGEEATQEWAEGLVANFARPPEGNDTAQIKAVAAGLGDVAIANSYYLVRLGKSDDPADQEVFSKVGAFFPNQSGRGTHVNISGAGMLSTAPNREGAVAFLEYLATPTAQKFFAEGNNEYPVVEGTDLDPMLKEMGDFVEDDVDVEAYGKYAQDAVQLMDRAGWE
ncbi:Fe(3+) ABC transporter substrate-binding protein [Oscillatoria sp. CS-180]|uniref:Fe(3+) ABC transporter substrate-binding protein n=1 Tax=Oscillatoria sp. CS-180 TaxID=3021720 RepID=UPI00232DADFD|nr:Fe(3+) ABC transporter substrate-binding protein [Oscillatoria sp. CS-180]MDB9526084.1 Fe(3+) ABC transporter substrate-binding protein [Oscillatoria sp. CS-180]